MNQKISQVLTVIGFALFILGTVALVLSLIDVRITIINWITDWLGRGVAFLVHLGMIITGLVLVVAARSNFAGEDAGLKKEIVTKDE